MYRPETEQTMRTFFAVLSERDRRLYAAVEASKLGHGGICYIASVLGCCERTIRRGLDELRQPSSVSLNRIRRKGGAQELSSIRSRFTGEFPRRPARSHCGRPHA
jgi:hypothetical protein